MKAILAVVVCLSVLISANCVAAAENDLVVGQITASLEKKFKMLIGDKAFTNLGTRSGVIKGDILTVYHESDTNRVDPIGECAIVEIYELRSVCEVITMKREIGMDTVTIKKPTYDDALLFPPIFALLTKVVEPYSPEKHIVVYVHEFFDENHNITRFSEKIRKEVMKVFFQKKRMRSAGKSISPAVFAYLPGEYNEYNRAIEDYLKRDRIDVIIAGTYRTVGDKVQLSFYKIDKNWEDIALDTTITAKPYVAMAAEVTVPFKERKKEKAVVCDIVYKPVYHKTDSRDERNRIINYETQNNPILEYTLRRAEFNIVAPVDFSLSIDGNEIRFDKSHEYRLPLTTGEHVITASFKKGFYYNDTFLVALSEPNAVKKTAVLSVDKPEDLVIEIEANPLPKQENIVFKMYRKVTRSTTVVKPVLKRETFKPVETFKD